MTAAPALPSLPPGWEWTTLDKVALYINGKAFKPTEWEDSGRPIIRIQNLTKSNQKLNRFSGDVEEKYIIQNGDLLISWSATLGAYIYQGEEAVLNQHIFKVIPFINKKFLYYLVSAFLNTLKAQVHGSGMQHITKDKFDSTPIPLPPEPVQLEIVDKIEELFTQLDAAEAALLRARANLKRYRQAVLQAAVTGELTRAWREAHREQIEPAGALLQRIRAERARAGKPAVPAPDASSLPSLPDGWEWVTVNLICDDMQYGTSEKANLDSSGIPVLRMGNIQDGELDLADLKYLPLNTEKIDKLFLHPGDVLFNRTNSVELVGKTAVYRENHPKATFASYLIRVKTINEYLPDLLSFFTNSFLGKQYLLSVVSQQVGQANVNGQKYRKMPIPLMDIREQHEIIDVVNLIMSQTNSTEVMIKNNLNRISYLRQSILQRAFSGQLLESPTQEEPAP